METERRIITLPGGRNLDVLTAGPARGLPLVLHEGTPVGLVLYPPMVRAAEIRGLRVILIARPGYEASAPTPGRRVVDVAADTAAVLDELGADTFVTLGCSGGGPHALACAAVFPGRCLAAASIGGIAPYDVKSLDWLAGMGPENFYKFAAAVRGEAALTGFIDRMAVVMSTVTGASVAQSLGSLVSDVDRAVLTGEFADHLAAGFRASINGGIVGWRDDYLAFVNDWGFSLGGGAEPGQVMSPVAVWHGGQDRMVPFAHGQWLAANIPGARAHLLPGEGHLSLRISSFGWILDDLLELAACLSSG